MPCHYVDNAILKGRGKQSATMTTCSTQAPLLGLVRRMIHAPSPEEEAQIHGELVCAAHALGSELVPSLWREEQHGDGLGLLFVYCLTRWLSPSGASVASLFKGDTLVLSQSMQVLGMEGSGLRPTELLEAMKRSRWPDEFLLKVSSMLRDIGEPRFRQHAMQYALDAISHQVNGASPGWIYASMEVLRVAVTDVWSAIRKESACVASTIVVQFPIVEMIDHFIESLLKIMMGDAWKAQEGALMTITRLISSIQVLKGTEKVVSSHEASAVDMIKGGGIPTGSVGFQIGSAHRGLTQLPCSLVVKLKPALYIALKHNQTCVRDAAAKCMVQFLGISDTTTRVLMFQEVMSKLNRLPSVDATCHEPDDELLEAFEAEGLLDVLAKLIPYLPVPFLIKHWKFVFPTLERYVVHIASSVRLRSSAVILALGELSLTENATDQSLDLLYQMIVALADLRDVVGVSWQRLEGRLLSIDLLVRLLGRENLWRVDKNLLHFQGRPSALTTEGWLSSSIRPQATWSLDEDAERSLSRPPNLHESIIQRLGSYVVTKRQESRELWHKVLAGWLAQTQAAFESSQFELRRISRQVLPGLVRLCVWCDCCSLLSSDRSLRSDAKLPNDTTMPPSAWTRTCWRYALLHMQDIRQTSSSNFSGKMESSFNSVISMIRDSCVQSSAQSDAETAVISVEIVLMAFLSARAVDLSWHQPLHVAISTVYNTIESSFHDPSLRVDLDGPLYDGSLDRLFSIAVVPVLPCLSARLPENVPSTLLRMLLRISLSWLVTDDMFRWITVDKSSAHAALVLTVSRLVSNSQVSIQDAELALSTFQVAVPLAQGNSRYQLRESLIGPMVIINAALWKSTLSVASDKLHTMVMTNLATLAASEHSIKITEDQPVEKSDWDDWDTEDERPKVTELRSSTFSSDGAPSIVATTLKTSLSPHEIEALRVALRSTASSASCGSDFMLNLVAQLATL